MNKFSNIIIAITFGLATGLTALAFSGPNSQPPMGNPAFWAKIGNDVYYNVIGGNVGIGTNGPIYKLDVQNGQINASGGLCIAGTCKTGWDQITGTNYWTLNGSNLYPNQTSYILGVGTASLDSNYKITTSGGGIKAESTNQPAGYFNSASGYGLIVNSGNVGIGTMSPGYKLDVAGDVRWTGTLQGGSVPWTTLTSFPSACSSGQYVSAVGSSLTCSAPAVGMPAGIILPYGGTSAPTGWLTADGSVVLRTTYANLFAVIGTTYGSGDGSTTFNLPNLKGKVPVGFNSAETEFDALGKAGGAKSVTPTVSGSNAADAASTMVAGGSNKGVAINAHTHSWSGSVSAVATVPPYLTINYIIKF